MKANNMKTSN